MFNTLYVLSGYNNYINRKLKFEDTINEYLEFDNMIFTGVNFNPNDEIYAEVTLNFSDYATADYVIVADQAGQNIISRWFIIDRVRVRGNQWNFTLRRDVVADYWNVIKSSPCFIEKANLDYNNPLIFNSENMTFNQIKTNEYLLKDKTDCPWIVGYYSKGSTLQGNVNINTDPEALSLNVQNITNWDFYEYTVNPMIGPQTYGAYNFKWADGSALSPSYLQITVNELTGDANRSAATAPVQLQHVGALLTANQFKEAFLNYGLKNLNPNPYSNVVSQTKVEELLSFNGKLVKTLDGTYHRIKITSIQNQNTISIPSGDLFNRLVEITKTLNMGGTPTIDTFKYTFVSQYYTVSVVEETNIATSYNIPNDRLLTTDAPWDMFAIPFGEIDIYDSSNNKILTTSKDYGIGAAMAMQASHPAIIYDIQLVPYCPVQSLIIGIKQIGVSDTKEYSLITSGPDNVPVGIIFNVPKSTFEFNIIKNDIKLAIDSIERKVNSECDKWRLSSPNFSNYFDFNVEKNGGISYFNVDINYKPFSPYIHINPNFNYLYGKDFNDPRGLVCGGDFSLSQIIVQWEQYQIQNRNFQNIFDRQIQNMEITNKYQRELDITSAIAGTLQGGVSGGATGMMASGGNPYAAIAGAAIGTAVSAAAGARDVQINQALRNEAIDFTKDNFGYQLGNIQALPNTISKVSAFNNNNKLFPVLEYYTCTEVEKEALRNKIKYNGMTVMTIGKIEDYITYDTSYIKGQLIQLPFINDDFHVANTIVGEVNKGLYIEGGYLNG